MNAASDSAPPAPPSRTNAELNLSVLRHHNPEITSILSIAPYAVVYLFSPIAQQWEKSGVEGTLFVCQLMPSQAGAERYIATVLNRRGLENFSVELLDGADVEVTEEYVILQVSESETDQRIYGLWIFSEPPPSSTANTRAINAQILHDCAVQAETSQRLVAQQEQTRSSQEPLQDSIAGPQLSLRELFGHAAPENGSSQPVAAPTPQFVPSADTDFFRSSSRPSQQQKPQQPAQQLRNGTQTNQSNILLDLFKKAGDGYRTGN